jgi:hypothetical protein
VNQLTNQVGEICIEQEANEVALSKTTNFLLPSNKSMCANGRRIGHNKVSIHHHLDRERDNLGGGSLPYQGKF